MKMWKIVAFTYKRVVYEIEPNKNAARKRIKDLFGDIVNRKVEIYDDNGILVGAKYYGNKNISWKI